MYFFELIVIPILVLYLISEKKTRFLFAEEFNIFIITILIAIIPSLLIQQQVISFGGQSVEEKELVEESLACNWAPVYCKDYSFRYLFSEKKHFFQSLSFILLGRNRKNYAPTWTPEGVISPNTQIYFKPIYAFYSIFFLIALTNCILYKKNRKKLLLFLSLFFGFIFIFGIYSGFRSQHNIYAESIGLIPLAAYGAYVLIKRFSKENKIKEKLLFIMITFLFILPFFVQNWYFQMREYADFNILPVLLIHLIFAVFVIVIFTLWLKRIKSKELSS